MSTVEVELIVTGVDVPAGMVVAAVDVVDSRLVKIAHSVVRAETPVRVDLPAGECFLVRGWTPRGDLIEGGASTAPGTSERLVKLRPQRLTASAAGPHRQDRAPGQEPPTQAGKSARHPTVQMTWWVRGSDAWRQQSGTTVPDECAGRVRLLPSPRETRAVEVADGCTLVQLSTDAGPDQLTVLPEDMDVLLAPLHCGGDDSDWSVRLISGAESTLLGYLHTGDLPSARTVAQAMLADSPVPGRPGGALGDAAVGYYLLRHGDDRFESWVRALLESRPDLVDTAVLAARLELRARRPDPQVVSGHLLGAMSRGLPLVADGLDYLSRSLSWCAGGGSESAAQALDKVRAYLRARRPALLTTFTGAHPGSPQPASSLPGRTEPSEFYPVRERSAVRSDGRTAFGNLAQPTEGQPWRPDRPCEADPVPGCQPAAMWPGDAAATVDAATFPESGELDLEWLLLLEIETPERVRSGGEASEALSGRDDAVGIRVLARRVQDGLWSVRARGSMRMQWVSLALTWADGAEVASGVLETDDDDGELDVTVTLASPGGRIEPPRSVRIRCEAP